MIFYRILDNKLYHINDVQKLGFEESEGMRIPDEYLENKEFMIMRTCFGIGDWGIISAMPRLLKEKYPNCKVYVPSSNLIKKLFGVDTNMCEVIFNSNPYVDDFKDYIIGEVFHDHYRVYDERNSNIPLLEQMLKFWQLENFEYTDSQPEIYFSEEERLFGDSIINRFVGDEKFGCLLVSDRFGTQKGIYNKKSFDNDYNKTFKLLEENPLPYFYWSYKPLDEIGFTSIDKVLDMRHIDLRIQLYIKSKAKVNISNQCGANHLVVRYSKCYEIQRQFPISHNFVKGEIYL